MSSSTFILIRFKIFLNNHYLNRTTIFLQGDFKTIIEGTRASNNLPTGVNWNFYNSYPKFKKVISSRQNHVLKLYV